MNKLVYKTAHSEEVELWIYDTGNPQTDKGRTAMLWIHGGGWNSGSPDYFADDYDYFTEKGIVCFSVDYRWVSKTKNDPFAERLHYAIADCFDAFEYIKDNADKFGIDPAKIVILGESAGGHLALCFATKVAENLGRKITPKAVIAYNPVIETVGKWSVSTGRYEDIHFTTEEFYKRHKILKGISPSHNIENNKIPLLLLTGIDDRVVYPGEVVDFYERYKAAGNEAQIELYENTSHAFALPEWYDGGRESLDKSMATVKAFLNTYSLI